MFGRWHNGHGFPDTRTRTTSHLGEDVPEVSLPQDEVVVIPFTAYQLKRAVHDLALSRLPKVFVSFAS